MPNVGEITEILRRISTGDSGATQLLLPEVYGELKKIAAVHLKRERKGHTLQPTALVNEVFLKMFGNMDVSWQSRSHFFAIASKVMRRYLTDYARKHLAMKRGGECMLLSLDETKMKASTASVEFGSLDQALTRLEEMDSRRAQVVEMRFFGGMTDEEIGEVLGLSSRTIKRDWDLARAWLYGELSK